MSDMRPLDPAVARSIQLVIFDVDGVLTDAGVYVGATESGEAVELKRFDILYIFYEHIKYTLAVKHKVMHALGA